MPGEVELKYETIHKDIEALEETSEYWGDEQNVSISQDGQFIMEGGNDICISTTLSYVITLKQEIK